MIIQTAKRIGTVEEYYFSRKLREIAQLRKQGKEIINLGIGSPDLPPAPEVVNELRAAAQNPAFHAYQSYSGIPELRIAFANWYQQYFSISLDPNSEVLPLIGSKEGIMHIAMTFLEAGDEVLIPDPGYPAYAATARLAGATPRIYTLRAENNWLPDLKDLEQTDLSKVKILWINYPHMPTGTPATRELFTNLVAFAEKHKILLVNDNPYSFLLNDSPLSIFSVPGARAVALELNSLSKSHNMAGWRIGMLAGHPDYLREVIKFKSNMDSGMFRPLQLAAVKALALSPDWYQSQNKLYRERQEIVFRIMDTLSCTYEKNQVGMFVWAKIPNGYKDSYVLSDDLLERTNIFVTPGGIFGAGGTEYIRISLCAKPRILQEALDKFKQIKMNNKTV